MAPGRDIIVVVDFGQVVSGSITEVSSGHRFVSAMNKKNRGGGGGGPNAAGGGVDRSKGGHMAGGSQSRCEQKTRIGL